MAQSAETLIEIQNLSTSFMVEGQKFHAINDVSFNIKKGQTLGVVGESGCGKSVTALSILRLIQSPPGQIESGRIVFQGKDLLSLSNTDMQRVRGDRISMIFQEPMTALNPVFKIGMQTSEPFIFHRGMQKKEAREQAIAILKSVGIPAPEKRVDQYPHELSGGMRQRVMIAMALACRPELLIADEPTTALDVTIEAQILDLMGALQKELGMSIMFITHDLGVVAEMCDEVIVMYAGSIIERASVVELFQDPKHPYTQGLMASKVTIDQLKGSELKIIPGIVPSLFELPEGCPFQDRCPLVKEHCKHKQPELRPIGGPAHEVACFEAK